MNLVKLGLILLVGIGFGLGLSNLDATALFNNDNDAYHTTRHNWKNESGDYYGHMGRGYGHYFNEDEFIDNMLEDLSEEERLVVESKIDELLLKYQITLEDDEVMFDFMNELMEFIEESEIDFQNYNNCHMY